MVNAKLGGDVWRSLRRKQKSAEERNTRQISNLLVIPLPNHVPVDV